MVQVNRPTLADETYAHVKFFQRKWVQSFLPFLTSLAFHAGLIVLGYSIYRVATVIRAHVEPQTIIPESTIDGPQNPNIPEIKGHFGNANDPTTDLTQALDMKDTDPTSFNTARGDALRDSLHAGGDGDVAVADAIGIGPNGRIGRPGGIGPGFEEGSTRLTKFGRIPGGSETASPTLIRDIGNTRKVVFLCDATGSMNSIFSGLRQELHATIQNLAVTQSFDVIFFSDDKVLNLNPSGLLVANDANKKKSYSFMDDVTPRGMTNPIPAIRAAFAQQPEMMYVLTDGFDQVDSLESVYKEFATLNKDGKVKVNTILIGTPDQKELVDILKRIANDNNGTMKIVAKDQF